MTLAHPAMAPTLSVHAGLAELQIRLGAVVLITILAAESFDPRLMWDAARRETNAIGFKLVSHTA